MHNLFLIFFLKLVLEINVKCLLIEIFHNFLVINLFKKFQNIGTTLIIKYQNKQINNFPTHFLIQIEKILIFKCLHHFSNKQKAIQKILIIFPPDSLFQSLLDFPHFPEILFFLKFSNFVFFYLWRNLLNLFGNLAGRVQGGEKGIEGFLEI
jgi:hypothetical protein